MSKNITVINWGGLNYGDNELFFLLYKYYLHENYDKIYLFSDSNELFDGMEKVIYVDRIFGKRKKWISILYALLNSKQVFCGGGDIIRGEFGTTLILYLAAILNKNIAICGVGAKSPDSSNKVIYNIKNFMQNYVFKKSEMISVREEKSFDMIKKNVPNANVYKDLDLCFLYSMKLKRDRLESKVKKDKVLISVIPPNDMYKNKWGDDLYINLARTLDKIIDEYQLKPIFVPGTLEEQLKKNGHISLEGDDSIAKKVIKNMKNKNKVIIMDNIPDFNEFSQIANECRFFIGFRLHYIISSIINRIPFIAFSYADKIEGVLKTVNLEEYIFDLNEINEERLMEKVKMIINYEEDIRHKIDIEMKLIDNKLIDLDDKLTNFFCGNFERRF